MKKLRQWQDSNLRGETPADFESAALTPRPHCPCYQGERGVNYDYFYASPKPHNLSPHPYYINNLTVTFGQIHVRL